MCYDYAELMDMAAARALECDTWGQPFGDESDPQSGYAAFRTWLKDNASYCYTRLKLPTADEFSRLKAAMGSSEMQRLILALENRGDLRRRYTIEALAKRFLLNTSALKEGFKAVYGAPIAT